MGGVAVGYTVGAVGGGVVGGTVASASGHSGWSYHSNKDHHGAHNNSDVETDTDACVALLGPSSGVKGDDGQDEGGDGKGEADDRRTACHQRKDGEHEGTYGHSVVVLLRRIHTSGGRRCHRLCCHYE